MIGKYGLATNLFLGGVLLILGSGIRVFINDWFYVMIIGSIFAGGARPIILNAQNNFVKNWFSVSERSKIISILSFTNTFGLIIGFFIPGLIF